MFHIHMYKDSCEQKDNFTSILLRTLKSPLWYETMLFDKTLVFTIDDIQ